MIQRSFVAFTILLTTLATAAGCSNRKNDEIVLEYGRNKVLKHCYMLRSGDSIPSDYAFDTFERVTIKVVNGDWAEALRRVGLTEEQCSATVAH